LEYLFCYGAFLKLRTSSIAKLCALIVALIGGHPMVLNISVTTAKDFGCKVGFADNVCLIGASCT
jgi:hypothetical protein